MWTTSFPIISIAKTRSFMLPRKRRKGDIMKFCSKCGKEILDEAVVCPNCGCAVSGGAAPAYVNNAADEINIGLCVLAALVPLFGIIYWPLKSKETPKKARACGITGLVSWGIGIIFSVLFSALFSGLMYDLF